jgi:hypothetical protein
VNVGEQTIAGARSDALGCGAFDRDTWRAFGARRLGARDRDLLEIHLEACDLCRREATARRQQRNRTEARRQQFGPRLREYGVLGGVLRLVGVLTLVGTLLGALSLLALAVWSQMIPPPPVQVKYGPAASPTSATRAAPATGDPAAAAGEDAAAQAESPSPAFRPGYVPGGVPLPDYDPTSPRRAPVPVPRPGEPASPETRPKAAAPAESSRKAALQSRYRFDRDID